MCNFISWIEHDERIYFLENKDLKGKKFAEFKKMNGNLWMDDIVGHGAIRHFYPELGNAGKNCECEDFGDPSNFPDVIQSAIRGNRMSKFGVFPKGLLCAPLYAEYEKNRDALYAEYEKNRDAEYEKNIDAMVAEAWGLFWDEKNRAKAWCGKKGGE
jgi:hypothetical protein